MSGDPNRPWFRIQRLQTKMREAGIAGAWTPGTYHGPGPGPPGGRARMGFLWGPDGFVIAVAPTNSRQTIGLLRATGARRPVLLQFMSPVEGEDPREIIRMELSDFLEMLDVYTKWLAQEGRLTSDE